MKNEEWRNQKGIGMIVTDWHKEMKDVEMSWEEVIIKWLRLV